MITTSPGESVGTRNCSTLLLGTKIEAYRQTKRVDYGMVPKPLRDRPRARASWTPFLPRSGRLGLSTDHRRIERVHSMSGSLDTASKAQSNAPCSIQR
jgi:hypothetical protein